MEEPLVLIVEDSKVHQRLLTEAFKAAAYTTRFDVQSDAAGAWAAVDAMVMQPQAEWPRFAVVDIGLPGMSGIDLVDRIRHEARLERWPIIILTASTDPEDRAESMMADATAFFSKPSGAAGYRSLVRDILDFLGSDVDWPSPPRAARTEDPRPGGRRSR